jgi:hypothetical protein
VNIITKLTSLSFIRASRNTRTYMTPFLNTKENMHASSGKTMDYGND